MNSDNYFIIYDLEATCWENKSVTQEMEIIEIGAVKLHPKNLGIMDEFQSFVRPTSGPKLSEFCKALTHINQTDVDKALRFEEVFQKFLRWINSDDYSMCSWGNFDLELIKQECDRNNIKLEEIFVNNHINLKQVFNDFYSTRKGMKGAIRKIGATLDGRHHRAIDDAKNTVKIAQLILPILIS